MSIFLVKSNLNHNGTNFVPGQFIQGEDPSVFTSLVADGVLRQFDVETEEEAKEILASESPEEETPAVEETAPEDTWGAQPDAVVPTAVAGDACELPDGSEGVLAEQDGALVCSVKEEAPAEEGEVAGSEETTPELSGDNL